MEIVSSSNMIRRFRAIKEFTLDMGLSRTSEASKEGNRGPGQVIIKIKDPFVKRYQLQKGNYISKTGSIGSLSFYTDNTLSYNSFIIYDQDKEYEYECPNNIVDIRNYLSNILDKILEGESEHNKLDMNMEENIEFKLDKNLPQSEFVEEHRKMMIDMEKMGVKMPGQK